MSTARCASSHLMTSLLTWRNPLGSEEHWESAPENLENEKPHKGKVFCTELALPLLLFTAAIESAVYIPLTVLSAVFYPITDRPYKFFSQLLKSSFFTVFWSTHAMGKNLACDSHLFALENEARAQFPLPCFRQPNVPASPSVSKILSEQEIIDLGTKFLWSEIMEKELPKAEDLIVMWDGDFAIFVFSKAVYIYAIDSKKKEEIPSFFKPETQEEIRKLRRNPPNNTALEQLNTSFSSYTNFQQSSVNANTQDTFNSVRGIGSEEYQNSILYTKCWGQIVARLER